MSSIFEDHSGKVGEVKTSYYSPITKLNPISGDSVYFIADIVSSTHYKVDFVYLIKLFVNNFFLLELSGFKIQKKLNQELLILQVAVLNEWEFFVLFPII